MESMTKRILRLVSVSLFLIAGVGVVSVFSKQPYMPSWGEPLLSIASAAFLIAVFYRFVARGWMMWTIATAALITGALAISMPIVYMEYGLGSDLLIRWPFVASSGGWLIVLGIAGLLPSRMFRVRAVRPAGGMSAWFTWTFALAGLVLLYGVSQGMMVWQRALASSASAVPLSSTRELAIHSWKLGATHILLAASNLLFVHVLSRLFSRRFMLWGVLLFLGGLLAYLRVLADAAWLAAWLRRLASDLLRHWPYATDVGSFIVVAAFLGIFRRPVRVASPVELPAYEEAQEL